MPRIMDALRVQEEEPGDKRGFFSCTVGRRCFPQDECTVFLQLIPDGKIFKINKLYASEDLYPGQELEFVPGLPMMLRMRRPLPEKK